MRRVWLASGAVRVPLPFFHFIYICTVFVFCKKIALVCVSMSAHRRRSLPPWFHPPFLHRFPPIPSSILHPPISITVHSLPSTNDHHSSATLNLPLPTLHPPIKHPPSSLTPPPLYPPPDRDPCRGASVGLGGGGTWEGAAFHTGGLDKYIALAQV